MDELSRLFRNPQNEVLVVLAVTQKLKMFQRTLSSDLRPLISYDALMRKKIQSVLAHGFHADLRAIYLKKLAPDKLPHSLRLNWSEHTVVKTVGIPGQSEF